MNQDPYAMSQELIEAQTRISELMVALERMVEQRDNAVDAAESIHKELEAMRIMHMKSKADIDRLRIHLQQGIEL